MEFNFFSHEDIFESRKFCQNWDSWNMTLRFKRLTSPSKWLTLHYFQTAVETVIFKTERLLKTRIEFLKPGLNRFLEIF